MSASQIYRVHQNAVVQRWNKDLLKAFFEQKPFEQLVDVNFVQKPLHMASPWHQASCAALQPDWCQSVLSVLPV
jgi:hypothetical protein